MSDARPLSAMQRAMMVQEALAGHPMYTMPVRFTISGPLDADALEESLHHVLGRHPVLLSTYDGEFALPSPRGFSGLRRLTGGTDTSVAALTGLGDTRFDLATEVPVRAVLVADSPGEHSLGLAVHHVAGDSWSLALLLRELGRAYAAAVARTTPDLDPAPDFFAYAAREQEREWGAESDWWHARLAGAPVRPAPRTGPPTGQESGTYVVADLGIDAHDTREIRATARAEHVSPSTVLFTAVSAAVTGERHESVVGLPAALRDTARRQATVGPLINTLPVRTSWTAGTRGAELLRAHALSMEEALAHKDTPYPVILRAAGARRGSGADPLLVHMVNVDPVAPDLPLPGLRTRARPIAPRWANVPALWEFTWGTVGNFRGVLRADADSFTPQDVREAAGRFRHALRQLVLQPR
ncbi:condensation domain-containing protein [Streptomyces albidoflavus]